MRRTSCRAILSTFQTCSRGRYSSMLDMGGVSPADAKNAAIDAGKNNRVRAAVLDFNLVTRSIEELRRQEEEDAAALAAEAEAAAGGARAVERRALESTGAAPSGHAVRPDTSLVQKMASLLNIRLGGDDSAGERSKIPEESYGNDPRSKEEEKASSLPFSSPHEDVRSKYASKLRRKIDGGAAGLDLARSERDDGLKRGDAHSRMTAQAVVARSGGGDDPATRWLAATGAGKLLSFLSARSMRIALLPPPSTPDRPQTAGDLRQTAREMEGLARQFPNVRFDVLSDIGDDAGADAAGLMDRVRSRLDDVPPGKFVVVSDRDDCLRAARDGGMLTCRVRPKSARRGEVTSNYCVEEMGDVESVVNEINGISFNVAVKG